MEGFEGEMCGMSLKDEEKNYLRNWRQAGVLY